MDLTPYLGTIVAIVGGIFGVYVAISSKLTKLETLIEDNQRLYQTELANLRRDVEKHNQTIERTYELEQTSAVHEQRITANEARIKKLEGAA